MLFHFATVKYEINKVLYALHNKDIKWSFYVGLFLVLYHSVPFVGCRLREKINLGRVFQSLD